jgi:hypothetical protein
MFRKDEMADSYVIEIKNTPEVEGTPLRQIWYAHIPERNRAIKAVRKAAGAGRHAAVEIVRPERHKILLERLALLEGEVRPE